MHAECKPVSIKTKTNVCPVRKRQSAVVNKIRLLMRDRRGWGRRDGEWMDESKKGKTLGKKFL
jgi:hypothetical protein